MSKLNQIRAARGLLGWHQKDLARIAGISELSVINIENGKTSPQQSTLNKITQAFEQEGVEFTDDGGVRPRQSRIYRFVGVDGFRKFYDEVYETAKAETSPDICVTNVKEELFYKWHTDAGSGHRARMKSLGKTIRALLQAGDMNSKGASYAIYRWLTQDKFANVPLYLYGKRTAFIEFSEDNVIITVTDSPTINDAMRKMFETMWTIASEKPL